MKNNAFNWIKIRNKGFILKVCHLMKRKDNKMKIKIIPKIKRMSLAIEEFFFIFFHGLPSLSHHPSLSNQATPIFYLLCSFSYSRYKNKAFSYLPIYWSNYWIFLSSYFSSEIIYHANRRGYCHFSHFWKFTSR